MTKSMIFILILINSLIHAQQPAITNLVFEGAGIRGIAYSGAIKELENRNLLKGIEKVGGTSAGAITAMLLSLGYTSDEITEVINSTSFKKFNDGNLFFVGGINRFKKYFGWYRGNKFEKWLKQIIGRKTGNENITFAELHAQGYKDLYVTGTCLNKQTLVVFSHETYPHMKVKDAVRISSSIPFYFEAVFVNAVGNIIDHPENKSGLDVMVDGGFTANFPIRLFDSTKYMGIPGQNTFMINPATIGFRIDRDDQIRNDATGMGLAPMPVDDIKDYFGAFYNIVIENLNRQTLTRQDWQRTISISDGNISPRIRKLSQKEISTLTTQAARATMEFLIAD